MGHSHGGHGSHALDTEVGLWVVKITFFVLLGTSVEEGHAVAERVEHELLHHVGIYSGAWYM